MRIGAHLSIGKGFAGVADEARTLGCEAVQVFSRSPRGGRAKPLGEDDVNRFRTALEEAGIQPLVVHAPYYLNLASGEPARYEYSCEVLAEDVRRAATLGASFVVVHPGHRPADAQRGLERVAAAVRAAIEHGPEGVTVLIENTAGQAREVGADFEEIAGILGLVGLPGRTGICLDTCHAFAAGFEVRNDEGLNRVLDRMERVAWPGVVRLVHLNDSVHDLGSARDRHAHVGEGKIGIEGFRAIVNHGRLRELAGIIETPVDDSESNRKNLNTLRGLRLTT